MTRLQARSPRDLGSISKKDKRLSSCQSLQTGTEVHISFFQWVPKTKRPGREAVYHQNPNAKLKDQLTVSALSVLTAVLKRRLSAVAGF